MVLESYNEPPLINHWMFKKNLKDLSPTLESFIKLYSYGKYMQ